MKNIYEKITIGGLFEDVLRSERIDTKVLLKKNDKMYGVFSGYGVQESTYYLKAKPYKKNDSDFLTANEILRIIDLQKEEVLSYCKENYDEQAYDSFESHINESVEDESIYDKIGLDSLSIFLEEEDNLIDFFDRCKDAYSIDDWAKYKKSVDVLGITTVIFTDK